MQYLKLSAWLQGREQKGKKKETCKYGNAWHNPKIVL